MIKIKTVFKQFINSFKIKPNIKKGGILLTIGFLLSPLSWWNDTFINLPIAYLIGVLFGIISKRLFLPATVVGYWLTNIVGLILMHAGTQKIFTNQGKAKNIILRQILISLAYTALIIVLVVLKILKSPL
ncbi:MAG: hypothetical protein N2748_03145 [candidate division WOR-3 bacterium]|nr:hypothetical protein [candidate division WOR-3 bacterium]